MNETVIRIYLIETLLLEQEGNLEEKAQCSYSRLHKILTSASKFAR